MHEDRKQKEGRWREQWVCGNEEEHSRKQKGEELSVGFPTVGSFSFSRPPRPSCVPRIEIYRRVRSVCFKHVHSLVFFPVCLCADFAFGRWNWASEVGAPLKPSRRGDPGRCEESHRENMVASVSVHNRVHRTAETQTRGGHTLTLSFTKDASESSAIWLMQVILKVHYLRKTMVSNSGIYTHWECKGES